jgi:hypothetical protein
MVGGSTFRFLSHKVTASIIILNDKIHMTQSTKTEKKIVVLDLEMEKFKVSTFRDSAMDGRMFQP